MIFGLNKISCKACGSFDIRAEETVSRTMLNIEWQLYNGRLYVYDYELDDEMSLGEPTYMWCNGCGNEFDTRYTSEHLNIPEEEE